MAKVGRKTKYNPDIHLILVKNLKRLGYTDEQIAKEIGVTVPTFVSWKKKYPEFLKVIKSGKKNQTSRVISALLRRAEGYESWEEKAVVIKGKVKIVRLKKRIEPHVGAQAFYLKCQEGWKEHDVLTLGFEPEAVDMINGLFSKAGKKIKE